MAHSTFRYMEPLRRESRVCQTDRRTVKRTDIILANAAFNCVAQPKTLTTSDKRNIADTSYYA